VVETEVANEVATKLATDVPNEERSTLNTPSNPHFGLVPSPWMTRFSHLIPAGARVLDLACGYGRHAHYFATRGAHVVAIDRDATALATLSGVPGIETRLADLEGGVWPLGDERFDAIVVSHYLYRPLFIGLRSALAADGSLLYETFARGNEAFGKPSNPEFLLRPGELLAFAAAATPPMTVVAFEQGLTDIAGRMGVVQRLAAVGAARAWPPALESSPAR
jgi:SAM-dependent methyltransferase